MTTASAAAKATARDPEVVLSRAAVRAAQLLSISQVDLADIFGVSPSTMSRIVNGQRQLETGSKAWQLATLFVRVFRALDAIVGSDDAAARAWLRGHNVALGGTPLDLMREPAGLVRTLDYLDAARARI